MIGTVDARVLHRHLAGYFREQTTGTAEITQRDAQELAYQWHEADELQALADTLSSIPYFMALYEGEAHYEVLRYWSELGDGFDIEACYREGLERYRASGAAEGSEVLARLAKLLEVVGCWDGAMELQREGLEGAIAMEDLAQEAGARVELGWLLFLRGEYETAFKELAQAYKQYQMLRHHRGASMASGIMGNVYCARGEYDRALECYREREAICREIGDLNGVAGAVINMGLVYKDRGEYDQAMKCYQQGKMICQELGNRPWLANAIGNMGDVYANRREYDQALECYQQEEMVRHELGDRHGLLMVINSMGLIYSDRGEYNRALEYYRRAETISRELGGRHQLSAVINNIGIVYTNRGDYEEAMECFGRELAIKEELDDRSGMARAIGNMGVVHYQQGRYAEALRCYRQALDGHRAIGYLSGVTSWLEGTSRILLELAEREQEMPEYLPEFVPGATQETWHALSLRAARENAGECVAISEELSKPDTLFSGRVLLARIEAAEGRPDVAVQRLYQMLEEATDDEQRAELRYWLWKLPLNHSDAERNEHRDESLHFYEQLLAKTPKHEYRKWIEELQQR